MKTARWTLTLAPAFALMAGLAAGEGQPRFGVAAISGTTACLASPGTPPADGTAVTLVVADKPQRVYRALVRARVAACTRLERAGIEGPYYEIAGPPAAGETPMAVAILGSVGATVANDVAEVTLGATGEPVMVRACSSHEGVHLTAWRGKPLEGRRLWHAYWYLGYDVEPSCTDKDVAP
jgi:hypothetical protein